MNNEKFQVELSGEFLPYLICLPGANPEETLRIVIAIVLYMMMKIDLEEAIMLSRQSAAHFNQLFRLLTESIRTDY
jgi:hypothetical protein